MSKPLNVFAVEPHDVWDGLPEFTRWSALKSALILDTGFRDFLPVSWASGPRNWEPWSVTHFNRTMRLTVKAGYFKLDQLVRPEWVSQLVLASGTVYNVTPTAWLLNEE